MSPDSSASQASPATSSAPAPAGSTARTSHRIAQIGTGGRALLYHGAIVARPQLQVAALLDSNPGRMAYHNRRLTAAGRAEAATYGPDEFERMVDENDIDTVIVTSMDVTHDAYIVPAIEAGLRVITEKPMTTDFDRAKRILDAVERTGNHITVTFNYRYNPVHERFARLIAEGAIGEVVSVHFDWMLDTRHGADYFRRWHRDKANNGGLMVHKASHHFDLVNWWIDQAPRTVFGFGQHAFYGRANGERLGLRHDYERAHGSPEAEHDPFAIRLDSNEQWRGLYLDNERYDGYIRDQNVFGDGITTEDDMAVLVRYDGGATMSYHLTAYSPWEGYRVMVNGTSGRLELDVTESAWTKPPQGAQVTDSPLHGERAADNAGGAQILLRPHWGPPQVVDVPFDHAGHGGGDARLLADLFGPEPGAEVAPADGASGLPADEVDGTLAMAVGAAANLSFDSGQPTDITALLGRELHRHASGR